MILSTNPMKISIITPTNNSSSTISKNVNSVINQTYKEYEHIIIDNLSSDNTLQLIKNTYDHAGVSNKLRVISEKDWGISDAFNKGIKNSVGDVIGILNSDDYFYDESVLERVSIEFKNHDILFVHGNVYFIDEVYGSNIRKPLLCPIQRAMPYNHPTMFFRKFIYEKNGMFDTSYKFAMDFEFICRLEKSIPGFRDKGKYIGGDALVVMSAGGESWKNELESIKEVKQALQKFEFWNTNAFVSFLSRIVRTKLKNILSVLKLNSIIYLWRSIKWNTRT